MPAWTTPRTWDNEVVSAAKLNTEIRDNQQALKDPPSQNYESNESSDYTRSTTTYDNVDASDFSFTVVTNGGDVMIGIVGSFSTGGGGLAYVDVLVDGTRILNNNGKGLTTIAGVTGVFTPSFVTIVSGLSAGSHTFVLQWRPTGGTVTMYAGAGTANYDVHPQFWVRELT